MDLLAFINKHAIVYTCIGDSMNDKCLASEVIVDNPHELINEITEGKCFILVIRWWDRTPIGVCSPIGYGGRRDPRNPNNFYFAETFIERSFDKNTSSLQYIHYLNLTREQYKNHDIYPAFDIYFK